MIWISIFPVSPTPKSQLLFKPEPFLDLYTWHVSWIYLVDFAISEWTTSCQVITAFNILLFLPVHYFITHHESRNCTKCLVLYFFFCSLRPSNIQRMSLQHSLPIHSISHNHQTAPSSAFETYAYFRCCHMRADAEDDGPKGWLATAGPEMMTHPAKRV